MKHIYIFIFFLFAPFAAMAQTITVEPISKTLYCVGDTMIVTYQANGTFAPDNKFAAQLSDASGSFATYSNFGSDTSLNGSIPVELVSAGDHFHVRVISTDPCNISPANTNDIKALPYPSPFPVGGNRKLDSPTFIGFAGDSIVFFDRSSEPDGSIFVWKFNQDASPNFSTSPSTKILFPTPGSKTGTLAVTNAGGCSDTVSFQFNLISCFPLIPSTAHIVTGTETGSDLFVWVKGGGNYTTKSEHPPQTIFAEPGSSISTGDVSTGLYYIKNGASFIWASPNSYAAVVLNTGNRISFGHSVDTFYCNDLNFDYSQVSGSVQTKQEPTFRITQTSDRLYISSDQFPISVRLFSLLGTEIFSKHGSDELDIDLTLLTNGVYFAVIEAGGTREVRRIAIVH